MEEIMCRIMTELEELAHHSDPQALPFSLQTILDLQSLIDDITHCSIFDEFAAKSVSPSLLIPPISSAMDSAPLNVSLTASKLYLSLLLSQNAPVFTLFTPMSFLSFLRSIRRLKHRPVGQRKVSGRGKAGRKNVRKRNSLDSDDDGFDVMGLFCVLEKLVPLMGLIHLDRFPDCLKSLVQTMADVLVLGVELCRNVSQYNQLANTCLRVLREVLRTEHGDVDVTAAEVLKSLSSLILMPKSQARTFALGFVTSQMMSLTKVSDGVKRAVINFPRYLSHKAQDKSEPRALAVESIMEIVRVMELEDQIGFVKFVVQMAHGKSNLRLLAVDLILNLVTSFEDPLGVNSDDEMEEEPWGVCCLEALVKRCSDVNAAIRARALSNLAHLIGFLSSDRKCVVVLKKFMESVTVGDENIGGGINNILRRRCMDDKSAVRKAALLLATKLTTLLGGAFDEVVLKTMGMACSDPLISIRKAAIGALSEAFRTFSDKSVITEWLHSVPRLVTDNESSIQEECENLFLELVLERISQATSSTSYSGSISNARMKGENMDTEMEVLFPEGVLYLLKAICDREVSPWVKKICTNLGKKRRLKTKLVAALVNIIKLSESFWLSQSLPLEKWTAPPGAWFLLSEVSAYLSKAIDWEFLHHHWQLLDKNATSDECKSPFDQGDVFVEEECSEQNSMAWASDRVFLLQTISNVSMELPSEPAADLAHNLLKRIEEFNMHSTEVDAHAKALSTLCKRKASNLSEAEGLVMKWVHQILSRALKIIEKFISEHSEKKRESSFFTPPRSRKSMALSKSLAEANTAIYTIGTLVVVCPSADMSNVVPLIHTIITSGSSDPKSSKLLGPATSLKQTAPSLYIQGWLTMGKLCLADGKLAKSYIPIFVQELEKSELAALRNNLVVMMADFCVRYTALVDGYILKITRCLRDPCELVRRQTFILLARLLQRDYVKWRGVLFLRFLLSLVDESEKIRLLADFLFGNILKVKAPLLAYNSFVEAIFVLNDCHTHNGHKESHDSVKDGRLFSIRGNDENSRSKRMHIYVSLLKQMAPEHLLATFAKLCAEILAAASDGMLNLDDVTAQSVLQDAFHILACKEIRISSTRFSTSDSADIEEEGGAENGASSRGKAITQVVKKGLIQNTVPIFIELKRILESKNSPLIGSLMECLRVILKDYKNEIDEILVADKQLQKELIYDMQKYEAAKAKATVATMPKPSAHQSPEAKAFETMSKTHGAQSKLKDEHEKSKKVASAMADAAAAATARSVLREVNKGTGTPPLSSLGVPKVKSRTSAPSSIGDRHPDVIESLRKRQSFDSDDEN